jgi:hypothetical protein
LKALQVYFKVPADVQGEEGRFVASCFLLTATCTGATKHEALSALTEAVQAFLAQQCAGRTLDDVLRRHNLHLPHPDEELVTGRYIDVSVLLKIPALN